MKILITGGTGFIGSALCSRLLEDKNHDVILFTRHPEKVKAPFIQSTKGSDSIDIE